jgi:hypothetical protein
MRRYERRETRHENMYSINLCRQGTGGKQCDDNMDLRNVRLQLDCLLCWPYVCSISTCAATFVMWLLLKSGNVCTPRLWPPDWAPTVHPIQTCVCDPPHACTWAFLWSRYHLTLSLQEILASYPGNPVRPIAASFRHLISDVGLPKIRHGHFLTQSFLLCLQSHYYWTNYMVVLVHNLSKNTTPFEGPDGFTTVFRRVHYWPIFWAT